MQRYEIIYFTIVFYYFHNDKCFDMPSFDIVSKVDLQTLDNAVNASIKEIITRYDFKDSSTELNLDKKSLVIHILTENDMRLEAVEDVIRKRLIKQNIDPNCMDFGKEHYASGNKIKKDIAIKQGIDKDSSRKIMAEIKSSGIKVQAQIMDDQLRVSSKKIDDLQKIMGILRTKDLGIPIQFTNMK